MLFRYTLGSLFARRLSNLVAVVSIGLVISASVVSIAFYHGLKANLAATGRPDNLVVVQSGVLQTTKSQLGKAVIDQLEVLPQVASEGSEVLVSPETHLDVPIDDEGRDVALRGIEPIAFRVHDQVKLVEGRAPEKGSNELVIGKKLVGKAPQLKLGGSLEVGGELWPIVGVFSAEASALENEAWGDRSRAALQLKRPNLLCAVVRAKSLADVEPLSAAIAAMRLPDGKIGGWAISERKYYETTLGNIDAVTATVAGIIAVLVLGAIVAAANTLHASLSGRISEFAALWVVGHKRGRLVWLVLQESFLLCAASALIAVVVAGALGGADVRALLGGAIEFKLPFGLFEVGSAFGLAALIGLVGTLYPSVQILRRNLAGDLG